MAEPALESRQLPTDEVWMAHSDFSQSLGSFMLHAYSAHMGEADIEALNTEVERLHSTRLRVKEVTGKYPVVDPAIIDLLTGTSDTRVRTRMQFPNAVQNFVVRITQATEA